VKFFDEVRTVHAICGCYPASLFISTIITFPFDIVSKWASTTFIELGVENGFDAIFGVVVDNNGRGRILNTVWNGVRNVRFKHRSMEDWVNTMFISREFKSE